MRNGFSYVEIVISMLLICIVSLSVVDGIFVVIKNSRFARENYLADITTENILNVAKSNLVGKGILSNLSEEINNYGENFNTDKFNFTVSVRRISESGKINVNNDFEFSYGQETFLPVDIETLSNNEYTFSNITVHGKNDYLLVVDLFDKDGKHKKRMIEIVRF